MSRLHRNSIADLGIIDGRPVKYTNIILGRI
jgi:hypothetical protein